MLPDVKQRTIKPIIAETVAPGATVMTNEEDGRQLDGALERLHNSCIACHRAENVLYFRDAVERIKSNATR